MKKEPFKKHQKISIIEDFFPTSPLSSNLNFFLAGVESQCQIKNCASRVELEMIKKKGEERKLNILTATFSFDNLNAV